MNAEIFAALKQLERERGIPTDYMVDKITQALTAAYKKNCEGYKENIHVVLGEEGIRMYAQKEVVDEVLSPMTEITLDAAREIESTAQLGDLVDHGLPAGALPERIARLCAVRRDARCAEAVHMLLRRRLGGRFPLALLAGAEPAGGRADDGRALGR